MSNVTVTLQEIEARTSLDGQMAKIRMVAAPRSDYFSCSTQNNDHLPDFTSVTDSGTWNPDHLIPAWAWPHIVNTASTCGVSIPGWVRARLDPEGLDLDVPEADVEIVRYRMRFFLAKGTLAWSQRDDLARLVDWREGLLEYHGPQYWWCHLWGAKAHEARLVWHYHTDAGWAVPTIQEIAAQHGMTLTQGGHRV